MKQMKRKQTRKSMKHCINLINSQPIDHEKKDFARHSTDIKMVRMYYENYILISLTIQMR